MLDDAMLIREISDDYPEAFISYKKLEYSAMIAILNSAIEGDHYCAYLIDLDSSIDIFTIKILVNTLMMKGYIVKVIRDTDLYQLDIYW